MSRALNRLLVPLVLLLVLGAGEAWAGDEFRQHLAQGVALYKKEQFRDAIVEFQAAYALRPVPRLLFNMAQAYRKLGDAKNALLFYERDLQTDRHQTAAERTEVRSYIEEMKALLAQQNPPAGDRAQPEQATASTQQQPEAKRPQWLPPWPQLSLIGGGAAFLIIGLGLGGAAQADSRQVEDPNPDGTFNAGLFQQGRNLNIATITFDVLGALALTGGGAWTAWWYLNRKPASPGVAAPVPTGTWLQLCGGL